MSIRSCPVGKAEEQVQSAPGHRHAAAEDDDDGRRRREVQRGRPHGGVHVCAQRRGVTAAEVIERALRAATSMSRRPTPRPARGGPSQSSSTSAADGSVSERRSAPHMLAAAAAPSRTARGQHVHDRRRLWRRSGSARSSWVRQEASRRDVRRRRRRVRARRTRQRRVVLTVRRLSDSPPSPKTPHPRRERASEGAVTRCATRGITQRMAGDSGGAAPLGSLAAAARRAAVGGGSRPISPASSS